MIVAWVLFPLVMLVACTGCGLLLDALAGWRLPGPLLPLSGLALAVVALSFTTNSTATSEASTPLLCVIAVVGLYLGRGRLRAGRGDRWALALGLLVFLLCAAPVVMSGNATFLGYYILNDSSFHLGLANLLVGHGPNTNDLTQSGYTSLVGGYVYTSYPTGADIALGALSRIAGQNVTWTLQPYLAVVVALGAVGVYELLGEVATSARLRAACAFIAGANGFFYSLYMVASIKELLSAGVLTLLAYVTVTSARDLRPRGVIPVIVVAVCMFDVLGITAIPWLGVPLAGYAGAILWRARPVVRRWARTRAQPGAPALLSRPLLSRLAPLVTVAGLGLAAALVPIIDKAPQFLAVSNHVLSSSQDSGAGALGYLVEPLSRWQVFGIWPDYDFRFPLAAHVNLTFTLIGIELASAVLGTLWLIRTRRWAPLVLIAGNALAAVYLLHRSTPYAASKVLLIVCIAVVMAVTTGAAALHDARRRIEAWLLLAVLAAGVLWTDGLAYRYDSVAPSARLHELAAIDHRYSGEGPVLFPYGSDSLANYLLHDLTPWDAYQPGVIPRPGLTVTAFAMYNLRWDTDNLDPTFLAKFRLLVMDGSPAFSRPPGDYTLVDRGRYYNVWRRNRTDVIEHVGLGTYPYSAAVPSCRVVHATARRAERDHARLAYVLGSPTATLIPSHLQHLPPGWVPIGGDGDELIPRQGPGTLHGTITVPVAGRYQVWFDGSFGQKFTVSVDGHPVGSIADQLGPPQQATEIATIALEAGRHAVTITRPPASSLLPGHDDQNPNNRSVGPLMFVHDAPDDTVSTIAPNRASTLCGRSLDWLEIVR